MHDDKQNIWFCELCALFGYIALLSGIYWIFSRADSGVLSDPATLPWYACAALSFFALRLYLRKERTLFAASVFALAAFFIQSVLLFWLCGRLPGFFGYAFALFFWAVVAYGSYSFNLHGISLGQMTNLMEGSAAFMALMLFYQQATGLSVYFALPLLASVLLSLISLIVLRTSGVQRGPGASGFRGFVVVLCLLLLLGVCIFAFLLFASAPVGEAVIWGYRALASGVVFLLGVLGRVLLFLFSLLPQPEEGAMPGPPPAGEELPPMGEEAFQYPPLLEAMIVVLGVAALAALVLFLLRLRGVKVGGKAKVGGGASKGDRALFGKRLRSFLAFLRARLVFFWMALIHRFSPPGLLIYLERWAMLHRQARREGESISRFLKRLGESQPPAAALLAELSDALDIGFYAPAGLKAPFPKERAAAIRHCFTLK